MYWVCKYYMYQLLFYLYINFNHQQTKNSSLLFRESHVGFRWNMIILKIERWCSPAKLHLLSIFNFSLSITIVRPYSYLRLSKCDWPKLRRRLAYILNLVRLVLVKTIAISPLWNQFNFNLEAAFEYLCEKFILDWRLRQSLVTIVSK